MNDLIYRWLDRYPNRVMIVVKFKGSSRFIFIFSNSEDGNMNEMKR